jgi:hypothetical protein
MRDKGMKLNILVTIRDLLRREWVLDEMWQDNEGFVYFKSEGVEYRIDKGGDISSKKWTLHTTRENIRVPPEG